MRKDRVIQCVAVISLVGLTIFLYRKYMYDDIRIVRSDSHTPRKPLIFSHKWPPQEKWIRPGNLPDGINNLDQGDATLVDHISQHWLLPPSTLPLALAKPERDDFSQSKQSLIVDKLLGNRENGFFVESGAFNGETFSNSMFFEKIRNWTGVLIEAERTTFDEMVKRHRRSFLVNACLSPTRKPMKIPFRIGGVIGSLSDYMSDTHARRMDYELKKKNQTELIQCLPMFSILKAIGVTHVDFFSLDIEGAEPEVLQTLPLDQMTVDVFCIEHNGDTTNLKSIKNLLVKQHGYEIIKQNSQDIFLSRKGL